MSREWLVTNGLGGYACGTVAGANTRRYHAFLMASLAPPVERTLLVAKVDCSARYLGRWYPLAANEFADGAVDPRGFVHLESFTVSGGVPVWRYALADALVEQRIFMAPGANTAYLRLELLRASAPLQLEFKPLVSFRDYHSQNRGPQPFRATAGEGRCTVERAGVPLCRLAVAAGHYTAADLWYWNFLHREESARGFDALEDLWGPGTFTAELTLGRPLTFTATAEPCEPPSGEEVLAALAARSQRAVAALPTSAPPWVQSLAIAAEQFIVRRGAAAAGTVSVIAGYPWFTDWGRDTMIALPGLTTVLGRFDTAAAILRTYARFVDRGMLPNRFAEGAAAPEYNTADATLWLFQAVGEYLGARRDPDLAREMLPILVAIIRAHVEGTRYGIRVDPDGLLRAGEPGTQLTWMDAKHGDHAVTPRVGKPVELNALWLNALDVTARLAGRVGERAEKGLCSSLLTRAAEGFARFWNAERGCLYDVLDTPGSTLTAPLHDAQIRPNQLFAVALPYCVLTAAQMRAVVDTCAREHLTSHGLRSLSPQDPAYVGRYEGNAGQRDLAYHQGTVWSWLLGPFARAHYRVYGDAARAQRFLAPIEQHLAAACVGSVSEVFDGDAPHIARGCFAQAWSVAEILRAWVYLERQKKAKS